MLWLVDVIAKGPKERKPRLHRYLVSASDEERADAMARQEFTGGLPMYEATILEVQVCETEETVFKLGQRPLSATIAQRWQTPRVQTQERS
jgi:hypothetical protein